MKVYIVAHFFNLKDAKVFQSVTQIAETLNIHRNSIKFDENNLCIRNTYMIKRTEVIKNDNKGNKDALKNFYKDN